MPSRRVVVSSWVNYLLVFASFAILSQYLQLYLKARGMHASRIGLLLGCFELAGMAGSMLLGRLADHRSAYRGLLAACLSGGILAFVPLELTTLFPVYVASILFLGFAYRPAIALLDSLVSRILPDPARQYGRVRVAGSYGFILISLFLQFSGLVTGDVPHPIFVAFAVTAACAAAGVVLLPPAPRVAQSAVLASGEQRRDGFDLRFWAVVGVIFLGRFSMGAYYSFFSLYLKATFPGEGIGLFWAIGPLSEIITIWFSGPLLRRWGIRAMLVVSLAAISLRLGLFIVAPTFLVVALAQLLHAFTFGTFHTTAIAYVNGKIGHTQRGMGMGVYNALGVGLPTVLASAAGGFILEARGFTALFGFSAAIPLLGILILAVFGRRLLPPMHRA